MKTLKKSIYTGGFNYHEHFMAVVQLYKDGIIPKKSSVVYINRIKEKALAVNKYAKSNDIDFTARMAFNEVE